MTIQKRKHVLGLTVAMMALGLACTPVFAEHDERRDRESQAHRRDDVRSRGHDDRSHGRRADRHQARRHNDRHHDRHKDKGHVSIHVGSRHGYHHASYRRPHHVTYTYRTVHKPGYYEKRWVPPRYETRYDECGRPFQVLVCNGYYEKVWVPASYVNVREPVHYGHSYHRSSRHYGHRSGIQVSGHFRF